MKHRTSHTIRELLHVVAVCSTALALGCGGSSGSESAPELRVALNPVDVYRSVHASLGTPFLTSVGNGSATAADLAAQSDQIGRLIDASKVSECDFGIDFSDGLMTQLPHLAQQRVLARVLKADAARLLAEGDRDGAAKRVAAILRMSAQIGASAQCSIEYLVAASVSELANAFTQENPSLASAAWKTDIQQAMAEVDQQVFARAPAVLRQEGVVFAAWLRSTSDPEYTAAVNEVGLKPRTAEQRRSDAAKLQSHCEEIAMRFAGAQASAILQAIDARAKSAGIDDVAPVAHTIRTATDQVRASAEKAHAALK